MLGPVKAGRAPQHDFETSMILEYVSTNLFYTLLKDGLGAARGRKRRLSISDVLALRKKWKEEIEAKLWERQERKLGMDVIIRDAKRVDHYPDTEDTKRGISSWYRCGLMGTYHRGVLLGLSWESLTLDKSDEYRYTNHKAGETGDIKVVLIGYVRYENIADINWDGDEYRRQPHIFCYFDEKKGEPYEKLAFCEQRELRKIPYYNEISLYEPVRKLSKKLGVR